MPKLVKFLDENWKKLLDSDPKLKPRKKRKQASATADTEESVSHKKTKRKTKAEIWFDDVDKVLIENDAKDEEQYDNAATESALVKAHSYNGSTKIVAIDCEMVGVGDDGRDSILARVSIVNRFGKCIYDKYVKSLEPVTDYRTEFSGIRPKDLEQNGQDFKTVQKEVSDIIKNRILVGHAIHNDLQVLFLGHPKSKIRDTSKYKAFKRLFGGRTPSLKGLTQQVLGVTVQSGEHDSVQDAQAAMRLYTMHRKQWEADIRSRRRRRAQNGKISKSGSNGHLNGVNS